LKYKVLYTVLPGENVTQLFDDTRDAVQGHNGTMKKEMRHWLLGELQHCHRQMVDDYETEARREIKIAMTEKQELSDCVLSREKDEFNHDVDIC